MTRPRDAAAGTRAIRLRGEALPRYGERASRIEFKYLGGPQPYLRIGAGGEGDDYVGSVDGRSSIRALRDYLTRALPHRATPARGKGRRN